MDKILTVFPFNKIAIGHSILEPVTALGLGDDQVIKCPFVEQTLDLVRKRLLLLSCHKSSNRDIIPGISVFQHGGLEMALALMFFSLQA